MTYHEMQRPPSNALYIICKNLLKTEHPLVLGLLWSKNFSEL